MRDIQFGLGFLVGFVVGLDRGFAHALTGPLGFAGPHGPWSIVSVTIFQSLGFSS